MAAQTTMAAEKLLFYFGQLFDDATVGATVGAGIGSNPGGLAGNGHLIIQSEGAVAAFIAGTLPKSVLARYSAVAFLAEATADQYLLLRQEISDRSIPLSTVHSDEISLGAEVATLGGLLANSTAIGRIAAVAGIEIIILQNPVKWDAQFPSAGNTLLALRSLFENSTPPVPPPLPMVAVPTTEAVVANQETAINGVSISDPLAIGSADKLVLTVTASSGAISVTDVSGIIASGSGSAGIQLNGSLEQINADLATLTYTGSSPGSASIDLDVIDDYGVEVTGSIGVTINASPTPTPPPTPNKSPKATAWGEVHMVTFDDLLYDFQAVGEFVLAESTVAGDSYQVQARLQPYGTSTSISIMTQIAAEVGSDRVTFDDTRANIVWVDGTPSTLSATNPTITLNGGTLTEVSPSQFLVKWNTGETLNVTNWGPYLQISTQLSPTDGPGSVKGLLGSDTGQTNDFQLADGTVIKQPLTKAELYGEFANAWRVTQASSLLDYGTGQTTATFTNLNFPFQPADLSDFTAAQVAAAAQLVAAAGITDPNVAAAAELDYLETGDTSFISGAVAASQSDPNTTQADITPTPTPTPPTLITASETSGQTFTSTGTILPTGSVTPITWTGTATSSFSTADRIWTAYSGLMSDEILKQTTQAGSTTFTDPTLTALGAPGGDSGLAINGITSLVSGDLNNPTATDDISYSFSSPVPAGNSFLLWGPGGWISSGSNSDTGPFTFTFSATLNGQAVSTSGWKFSVEAPFGGKPTWSYSVNASTGQVTINTVVGTSPFPDAVIVATPNAPVDGISVKANTLANDGWGLAFPDGPTAPTSGGFNGDQVSLAVYDPAIVPADIIGQATATVTPGTPTFANLGALATPGASVAPVDGSVALNGNTMTFLYSPSEEGVTFASGSFNGYELHTVASDPAITAASLISTDIHGLTAADLSFSAHTVDLNVAGLTLPIGVQGSIVLGFNFAGQTASTSTLVAHPTT